MYPFSLLIALPLPSSSSACQGSDRSYFIQGVWIMSKELADPANQRWASKTATSGSLKAASWLQLSPQRLPGSTRELGVYTSWTQSGSSETLTYTWSAAFAQALGNFSTPTRLLLPTASLCGWAQRTTSTCSTMQPCQLHRGASPRPSPFCRRFVCCDFELKCAVRYTITTTSDQKAQYLQ